MSAGDIQVTCVCTILYVEVTGDIQVTCVRVHVEVSGDMHTHALCLHGLQTNDCTELCMQFPQVITLYLPFKRVWQSMGLPGVVQFVGLLLEEAPEWRHTGYTKGRGRDHMEGMGTDHMEGEGQGPHGGEGQSPHGGRETTQTHHVRKHNKKKQTRVGDKQCPGASAQHVIDTQGEGGKMQG